MPGNKKRAAQHSSVWIDPALSPYFTRRTDERKPNGTSVPKHPQQHPAQTGAHQVRRGNPTTPIPPRASAQPAGSITVRPRYPRSYVYPTQESDVARMPTLPPPTMWEYESAEFQAGSSLSSLSLVVDAPTIPDTPIRRDQRAVEIVEHETQPPLPPQRRELTIDEIQTIPPVPTPRGEVAIEEIDTIPPIKPQQHIYTIDEIDTIPDGRGSIPTAPDSTSPRSGSLPASALMVVPSVLPVSPALAPTTTLTLADAPASWTAGDAAHSRYAQRIAGRKGGKGIVWYGSQDASAFTRGRSPFRHPVDRLRWWLLHPGHLEFALWIGGTLLLMVVTVALLLAMVVSLFGMPSHTTTTSPANSVNTAPTSNAPAGHHTAMTLMLSGSGPLVAGQALHLHGQGFTPGATVMLTHDEGQPCQPASVQTDKHGAFSVSLDDSAWTAGMHRVIARDAASRRMTALTIILAPNPIGNKTSATPAANTPTPGSGVQSTPVNSNPSPTPSPTATSTPPPSPTPGLTPTVSPTASVTPSAGTPGIGTPGTGTPGASHDPASLSLAMTTSAAPFTSWLWLLIALGCSAALLLLGIVGVMRRKTLYK
jgi:hypothetical protein